MKTHYQHISEWERKSIERLAQAGSSNKAIAAILKLSVSTIGRELERNCWRLKIRAYRSEAADEVAKKRRRHERKSRISGEIWQKIFEMYNILKKIPLNSQKLSLILQQGCKIIKVLRGFGRSFTKDLSKLDTSGICRP